MSITLAMLFLKNNRTSHRYLLPCFLSTFPVVTTRWIGVARVFKEYRGPRLMTSPLYAI